MTNKSFVSGIVENIPQMVTTKGITYALVVNNIRYGTYLTEPNVAIGDSVSFQASQNGQYWNADMKTLSIAPSAVPSNPALNARPAPSAAKAAWVPDKDRQDSIIYQSARKDGLEFMKLLAGAGLLDFGKSKTNASKIASAEIFLDLYTMRFFEDTKNLGHKDDGSGEQFPEDADILETV